MNSLRFAVVVSFAALAAAACSSSPTSKQGLTLQVAVPTADEDNPLVQAGATFVAVTASGESGDLTAPVVQKLAPKGGVGMFFGTFNPFHRSHLMMVRREIGRAHV